MLFSDPGGKAGGLETGFIIEDWGNYVHAREGGIAVGPCM
jgi:hypothetical protein